MQLIYSIPVNIRLIIGYLELRFYECCHSWFYKNYSGFVILFVCPYVMFFFSLCFNSLYLIIYMYIAFLKTQSNAFRKSKLKKNIWIRCTFRFNGGSRIIENNLRFFFLFLTFAGGSNPADPYPNPTGHS